MKPSLNEHQNTIMQQMIQKATISTIHFSNRQLPTVLAGLISLLGKPKNNFRFSSITHIHWPENGVFFYIDHDEKGDTCRVSFIAGSDSGTRDTIYSWHNLNRN